MPAQSSGLSKSQTDSKAGRWLQQALEYPVFQSPMAGSQGSALAVAVSDAGGLGAIPCAMLSTQQVAEALQTVREKAGRIINVNFFCHQPPEPSAAAQSRWLEALSPYFDELNVDPSGVAAGAGRQPFSQEYLSAITPFEPEVVSFHFGLPDPVMIAAIKGWGGLVAASATTLEEGIWLEQNGADLVIAQGLEAGGHRGHFLRNDLEDQLPTESLVSALVQAIHVPVIAAGGISTPEQVAQMLHCGASAVQVGTAFLLTPEATTSEVHRAALRSDLVGETAITNLFSGRPARGMVNRLMIEQGPMSDKPPAFPLATNAVAPLRAAAESKASWDFSPLWAGTGAAACQEKAASDLVRWLCSAV